MPPRFLPLLAVALALGAGLAACSNGSSGPASAETPRPAVDPDSVAYFAGGCFWGVEHYMQKLDGVATVESGFMGGEVPSPSYEDVLAKGSGHLETVRVRFDADLVSYAQVAQRFFEIHDPTQADGQGPDIGPQYRSAVFYGSAAQKRAAEQLIARLRERGYDVVTELRPASDFWPAEDYHQDYYETTGKLPYCHARVDRFGTDE